MDNKLNNSYVKRTQKDYSMSFKLQVVSEVEPGEASLSEARLKYGIQGENTIRVWLRKFGTLDWETQTPSNMPKTPEQKNMELEAKIRLLEKQKALLANQLKFQQDKAIVFDMLIDIAENDLNICIRKKRLPEQLKPSKNNRRKL